MRIRTKILLFVSTMLIVMAFLITALDAKNIADQGRQRIENYRTQAIEDVKRHLKDLVDIAYETVDRQHANLSNVDFLSQFYERRLNTIMDSGEAIIKRYQNAVDNRQMSLTRAKNLAKEEIKALRFDQGTGYIWINDIGEPFPRMVMHPTIPSLDGTLLDSPTFNNALGKSKNLFQAFVEITNDKADGYVDYLWPKPTEHGVTTIEVPKLSYVRRFQEWGWILGTGIYIDDAQQEIKAQIKLAIETMRYDNGTGYFWINDNSLPYPKMVMHPTVPSLNGKILNDEQFNNALGQDQNLFQAFVEVTRRSGAGYVDYLWPKPTSQGLTERLPKISYVRLHRPTGWIIGTGVYIDNIDQIIAQKEQQVFNQVNELIRYNVVAACLFLMLALAIAYGFSASFSRPIVKLTYLAEQVSKGKELDIQIKEIARKDEIGELAKSLDRLRNSTKIMLNRLMQSSRMQTRQQIKKRPQTEEVEEPA